MIEVILSVVGAVGGIEFIKFIFNYKSSKRTVDTGANKAQLDLFVQMNDYLTSQMEKLEMVSKTARIENRTEAEVHSIEHQNLTNKMEFLSSSFNDMKVSCDNTKVRLTKFIDEDLPVEILKVQLLTLMHAYDCVKNSVLINELYKKYKVLGGNSYVDTEYERYKQLVEN